MAGLRAANGTITYGLSLGRVAMAWTKYTKNTGYADPWLGSIRQTIET